MHHSEFVQGVRSGDLKVLVDRNKSGFFYQEKGTILEKWRMKQVAMRTVAFGAIAVGLALFVFVAWYFAVAVLLFGLFYVTRAHAAAGDGLLATALERPDVYARAVADGAIRVTKA
jgi:fatty acid desaturase